MQRHCIPVCSSTATVLQSHCNLFAVTLQQMCSNYKLYDCHSKQKAPQSLLSLCGTLFSL
ncbi:hypothetical protein DW800_18110 [Bacteroides sp. AM32-11AC]|uniref:Uncharacterized protein n=1 Tax=Bacteroides uniformis TaxID=820 RepID=A0A3E4PMJ5_BACUN|nr:hypothetical protein DXC91_18225 [Bacteroides uniformis]RJU40651.1 hypothetical protein DW800_18110 [Bacteroides sp. AM32-11AC]RGV38166.1 hypothetical protein DWW14_18835 [Bacteroides uniformis]RGV90747.1 hypothetical protein DWV99_13000 [Bacteroides uniformis]HCR02104.1 hypothetical protein [Bacteroides uniformis]